MDWLAHPNQGLRGEICLPGDKSLSHRAAIFAGLADGISRVRGFLPGEDTLATLRAMQSMGVQVDGDAEGELIIHGVGLHGLQSPSSAVDVGNAGTGMRLLCGLMAGAGVEATLTGDESLSRRPMERVAAPLRQMGAEVACSDGHAPLHLSGGGQIRGGDYQTGVASAQVKSALLLAGLFASGPVRVTEPAATRDHTERLLQACGVDCQIEGNAISLQPPTALKPLNMEVPGDPSSAAFWLVAASVRPGSEVLLKNVGLNPRRRAIVDLLRLMGSDIEELNKRQLGGEPVADLRVCTASLSGIDVPLGSVADAIDEFPALFVAAACANGVTRLRGAEELRVKESDRIAVMATGLRKLGVTIDEHADGVDIHGPTQWNAAELDVDHDHRCAMALAVAASAAGEASRVRGVDNVATSYPAFVQHAQALGWRIEAQGEDA
jgi:3-phosphoshikimate 1-carboxyvinyltransferase